MTRAQFVLEDDFVGIDLSGANPHSLIGGWTLIGAGSPAVTARASEADAPGIMRLSTSGSANDTALLTFDGLLPLSQQLLGVEFRIRANQTTLRGVYAGLATSIDVGMGSVSRHVQAVTTLDPNWFSAAQQGGADSVDTGVVSTTGWLTFRLGGNGSSAPGCCDTGGHTWVFDSAGAGAANLQHLSHMPSSGTALSFGLAIKTFTSSARSIDIDYLKIISTDLAR